MIEDEIRNATHVLIAGSTGSGKSTVINSTIYHLTSFAPSAVNLYLADPKMVDLEKWRNLPHVKGYADNLRDIEKMLNRVIGIMFDRLKWCKAHGVDKAPFCRIFVIIDELADLMTTGKKTISPLIIRIAQLGRAANIHLILATQRPTRDVINGQIQANIDYRLALRCPTAQDSRNIIHAAGAELLPRYGCGIWSAPPATLEKVKIDKIPDSAISARIAQYAKKSIWDKLWNW